MSLETQIAALVAAANNLTNAVNGKVGEIDGTMAQALAQFDQFRALKDVVGTPGEDGTLTMSVFQGQVWGTGGPIEPSSTGGFPTTDLGTTLGVYMHFKLPFNVNRDDRMFWMNIRGYSYGSAKIIDETLVGYCYTAQRELISKNAVGNATPALYVDSNGNCVMRIYCGNAYITAVRIDTMKVGIGDAVKPGEIQAKLSLADTVVF